MWDRWRNRLKNMFSSESTDDVENNELHTKQKIDAKVMYQYPRKTSFRFPIIPDSHQGDDSPDIPAYQRKRRKDEHDVTSDSLERHKTYAPKIVEKENRQPFKPSQVPSPIYGYQKRKEEKRIEDIPAFMRKNLQEEMKESEREIVLEPEIHKEVELVNKEQIIETAEIAPAEVEIAGDSNKGNNERIRPTKKRTKKIHKHPGKPKQQSKNKREENKTPFNVIMTPRDKKNLLDKRRAAANLKSVSQNNTTHPKQQDYVIPYHLLNDPVESSSEDRLWVQSQQELLERTLMHFNVQAKVVNATQGPSVTRFEVQPEFGVKVSKVRNLSDDIKLNMSAKDIRIEAPIPGKNTIGIEIPNLKSQMVGLQEIFETTAFRKSRSPLTIGLGLSVEGLPLITNISKMPHGLIAGATGSGKSVCINTILISLLYKSSHKDVKLLLIDPKMVELAPYNGIPHLVAPVITDVKAATAALKWAVNEMEERYEKFVRESVRDIERYNDKMVKENRVEEKMPFMVIVIDELADLMMLSPQDVEEAICRIAQKARACGMHLLLATQRPSVDVITGLIKANIPTRIAFSVSSQVDSRTIIDTNGADRLLGKGDMLFIENGSGKSIRLQGAFVSDEEIERVTNHARSVASPDYLFEQDELLQQIETDEDEDELFEEALEFVLQQNNASTSLLQRQFRIGYNRAARLIDSLENRGIISGQNGSKPRDILLSRSQLEEVL